MKQATVVWALLVVAAGASAQALTPDSSSKTTARATFTRPEG
jgi:hypothetical protein